MSLEIWRTLQNILNFRLFNGFWCTLLHTLFENLYSYCLNAHSLVSKCRLSLHNSANIPCLRISIHIVLLKYVEMYWTQMNYCVELSWTVLKLFELYCWTLVNAIERYWTLLEYIHWTALNSILSYWTVLSCNKLKCIELKWTTALNFIELFWTLFNCNVLCWTVLNCIVL